MQLTALVCTRCGAPLDIGEANKVHCSKCGTRYAWENTSARIPSNSRQQNLPGDDRVNALSIYAIEKALIADNRAYMFTLQRDGSSSTLTVFVEVFGEWEAVAYFRCGQYYRYILQKNSYSREEERLDWKGQLNSNNRMYQVTDDTIMYATPRNLAGDADLLAKFLEPFAQSVVWVAQERQEFSERVQREWQHEREKEARRAEMPWWRRWLP